LADIHLDPDYVQVVNKLIKAALKYRKIRGRYSVLSVAQNKERIELDFLISIARDF
jgi:hypothetical protein